MLKYSKYLLKSLIKKKLFSYQTIFFIKLKKKKKNKIFILLFYLLKVQFLSFLLNKRNQILKKVENFKNKNIDNEF